jgi:glycosyltransferase involved in cell wall biosynthesis
MAEFTLTDKPRATISVAIIAKDEEANLRRTLPSVAWADEIVLIDSGSSDHTVALAQSHGAKVFTEPWRGFAAQKNFAIDHCTSDWVLSLDADEEVSVELRAAIQHLLSGNPVHSTYYVRRRNYFLGRWLKHGGLYPDYKLRLFRRGSASFEDRPVHETLHSPESAGNLESDLLHHAYPNLAVYIEHMNRYSTASVSLLDQKKKTSPGIAAFLWNIFLIPVATFLYNYVMRLGFLDGREGLLFHLYHSTYVSWKYAKAWHKAHAN